MWNKVSKVAFVALVGKQTAETYLLIQACVNGFTVSDDQCLRDDNGRLDAPDFGTPQKIERRRISLYTLGEEIFSQSKRFSYITV